MSKILALKQRKQTIDGIYRSSCAMQAAAKMKVSKTEAILKDCQNSFQYIIKEYGSIVQKYFQFNVQFYEEKKLNLLIGCNKGFCGKFLSNLYDYVNVMKKDKAHTWFLIGSKLEILAKSKQLQYFSEVVEKEEEIFNLANELWEYIRLENITHFSIHSFSKGKIIKQEIFEKSLEEEIEICELEDETSVIFFIAARLAQAFLESALEENKQRAIAVEQAKTNAEGMAKIVNRLYNRARQEKITLELNEITAGMI